jgi:hypothetical protein
VRLRKIKIAAAPQNKKLRLRRKSKSSITKDTLPPPTCVLSPLCV